MKTLLTLALAAFLSLTITSCGGEAAGVTKVKAGGSGVKVGAKARADVNL